MIEADFNRRVNDKLDSKKIRSWKVIDDFQGGVPDNYYHRRDAPENNEYVKPLFIEYKLIKKLPKRSTTKIVPKCSALQIDWLKELHDNNSEPWVIVGYAGKTPARGVIYSYEETIVGITAAEFEQRLQSYAELGRKIEQRLGLDSISPILQ